MMRSRRRMQGLSLLELLVAFVIMAFALTALYRATGSAVRSVSTTEQHWRAATLAQSLLESRDSVAPGGWQESGEGGGLQWQVHSAPYATEVRGDAAPPLHQVEIVVRWTADGRARQLAVNTLLPQSRTPPGGVIR